MWKKLLGVTIFLAIVGIVCGLMLAPNSPYVKQKCRANSIKGHYLSFKFFPPDSDVRFVSLSNVGIIRFSLNAAKRCKVNNGFIQSRIRAGGPFLEGSEIDPKVFHTRKAILKQNLKPYEYRAVRNMYILICIPGFAYS